MSMRSAALPAVLLLTAVLSGCGMQKGETEVKYTKNTTNLNMSEATKTGDYALYTTTDLTPKVVRHLEKGDQLGFRKVENGRVEAVAGEFTMTLPSSTQQAYWKYYGDTNK
jgi:hypothetical protein